MKKETLDKNITNMEKNVIETAKRIIALNDRFRGAFFFTPPSSASERRRYERNNSEKVEFDHDNHHFVFDFVVECSCHNVYVRRNYTKDGKSTNITTLKNILTKIGQ